MKNLLCIDATWMLRRSFHATNKGFVTQVNEFTEEETEVQNPSIVVSSFLMCVLKELKKLDYQYEVNLLWDYGSWKYRPKEKFTEYKSDREYDNTFQCCWDATDIAVDLSRQLGFKSIRIKGLEADDLGMYFSHLPNEVILCTVDSDWKQNLSENTILMDTKSNVTRMEDVIQGSIETPFDLAISKAINSGGHDNLAVVSVEDRFLESYSGIDKHHKIISAYKDRNLPEDVLIAIDRNMQLSRLDKILSDKPVHEEIEFQRGLTTSPSKIELVSLLSKHLGKYPAYFLGVIGKYNKIHNS